MVSKPIRYALIITEIINTARVLLRSVFLSGHVIFLYALIIVFKKSFILIPIFKLLYYTKLQARPDSNQD